MNVRGCALVVALFLVGCVGEDPRPTTDSSSKPGTPTSQKEDPESDPNESAPPDNNTGGNTTPTTPTTPAANGVWKGAWHSTFNGSPMTGSITLSMTDGTAAKVTGNATFGSSPCVPSATIDATRSGSKINGKLLASNGATLDFTTTLAADGKSLSGVFSGEAGGCGNMAGTYDAKLE